MCHSSEPSVLFDSISDAIGGHRPKLSQGVAIHLHIHIRVISVLSRLAMVVFCITIDHDSTNKPIVQLSNVTEIVPERLNLYLYGHCTVQ